MPQTTYTGSQDPKDGSNGAWGAASTTHTLLRLSLQVNTWGKLLFFLINFHNSVGGEWPVQCCWKLQKSKVAQISWAHLIIASENSGQEGFSAGVDKHNGLREVWASRWPDLKRMWTGPDFSRKVLLLSPVVEVLTTPRLCYSGEIC